MGLPAGAGLPVAGAALVGVAAASAAVRLPGTPGEVRLAHAGVTAVGPPRVAETVGPDELAARVQLSTYAELTGVVERHATVLLAARELALLACAVLLLVLLALVRSLGVRPPAAFLVLSVLAACPPAVGALTRFGPGLLGAAWLTAGAALLARLRPGPRMLGVPVITVGVLSAPVLAVPLLVIAASLLVAERARRSPLVLAVALPTSVAPLVLLQPPAGDAAVPALVVVTVLAGFVVVDEVVARLGRRSAEMRRGVLGGVALVGAVAAALVLLSVPDALDRTPVGVPDAAGSLTGAEIDARTVPPVPPVALGALLADNPNLRAPDGVRALLRAGAVQTHPLTVLVGLTARGPLTVADLPPVPGEDPAAPRRRAVLTGVDAGARTWLSAQRPPYLPMVATTADETVLTWPVPAA